MRDVQAVLFAKCTASVVYTYHAYVCLSKRAGLTDELHTELVSRARSPPADGWRFPTFTGPHQDDTPDQDHLATTRAALQLSLLQELRWDQYGTAVLDSVRRDLRPQRFLRLWRRHLARQESSPWRVRVHAQRLAATAHAYAHDQRRVEESAVERSVVVVFPTWPTQQWNGAFKLRASQNTVISVSCAQGKLTSLEVQPAWRAGDVYVYGCAEISEEWATSPDMESVWLRAV